MAHEVGLAIVFKGVANLPSPILLFKRQLCYPQKLKWTDASFFSGDDDVAKGDAERLLFLPLLLLYSGFLSMLACHS